MHLPMFALIEKKLKVSCMIGKPSNLRQLNQDEQILRPRVAEATALGLGAAGATALGLGVANLAN